MLYYQRFMGAAIGLVVTWSFKKSMHKSDLGF